MAQCGGFGIVQKVRLLGVVHATRSPFDPRLAIAQSRRINRDL